MCADANAALKMFQKKENAKSKRPFTFLGGGDEANEFKFLFYAETFQP